MCFDALCCGSPTRWSSGQVPAGAHPHRKASIPHPLQKSACSSPTPATVHGNLPTLAVPKAVDNFVNNTRRLRRCWPAVGCPNSGHTSAKSSISDAGWLAFARGVGHYPDRHAPGKRSGGSRVRRVASGRDRPTIATGRCGMGTGQGAAIALSTITCASFRMRCRCSSPLKLSA